MKKRFLPLSMLLITIVLAQASFVANATGIQGKYTPRTGSKATFSSFMKSIRANQETGLIDPALMMAGRKAAQATSKDDDLTWNYAGPDNYGGMTRAMLYDNDGTIYIGTMGGNIFKSTNGGITFGRVTNFNLPISCMVKTADGNIYVGTGDGREAQTLNGLSDMGYETSFVGNGVYKLEGNQLVLVAASEGIEFVNEMAAVNNVIYAATSEGLMKDWQVIIEGNFRSVKANNNGDILAADESNVFLVKGNDITNVTDEIAANSNPKIIAMSPSYKNYMYIAYISGSAGEYSAGNIYFTNNGGTTWEIAMAGTTLYPIMGANANHNGFMIVYPDNPRKLLFGSDNLWVLSDATGLGVNSYRPKQVSYSTTLSYSSIYVHEGIQNIVFATSNTNVFFVGTNGGVFKGKYAQSNYTFTGSNRYYITDEQHTSVTRMMNVGIGGLNPVLGGCLDHGTIVIEGAENYNNVTTGVEVFPHVTNNGYASDVFSPDYAGGPCAISTINPSIMFVSGTGNLSTPIYRTETAGVDYDQNFEGGEEDPIITNANAFKTPYALFENYNDANNPVNDIYAPVRIVKHKGDTIFAYSHQGGYPVEYKLGEPPHDEEHMDDEGHYVWIPGDTIKGIHDPISTLYLLAIEDKVYMTRDALVFSKATEWCLISAIEGIPTAVAVSGDGDMAMVGTVEGNLYKVTGLSNAYTAAQASVDSTECVVTFTALTPISTQAVTGISIDPNNSDHILVSLGNYGNSNYLYRSSNGGTSFTACTGLPQVPVYSCLIANTYDDDNQMMLMAGTEIGLYASANGTTWTKTGEVSCPIMDLKQAVQVNHDAKIDVLYDEMGAATYVIYPGVENQGTIYAATYGAGIITCDDFRIAPVIEEDNEEPTVGVTEVEDLNIYPNPVRDFAQFDITVDNNASVSFVIYDLSGRTIANGNLGTYSKGTHTLNVDTKDLARGSYIIRVKAGDKTETGKFLVY